MSHRITCPHCATPLRLPEGLTAPSAVCPRCQGKVPNPEILEGSGTEDASRPVLALDDDLGTIAAGSNRGFLHALLLLMAGVLSGGLLSGLLGAKGRNRGAAGGFWLTMLVYALGVLLLLCFWLPRSRLIRGSPPGTMGRVMLFVALWLLFGVLAVIAAFVLFFISCAVGIYTGDALGL